MRAHPARAPRRRHVCTRAHAPAWRILPFTQHQTIEFGLSTARGGRSPIRDHLALLTALYQTSAGLEAPSGARRALCSSVVAPQHPRWRQWAFHHSPRSLRAYLDATRCRRHHAFDTVRGVAGEIRPPVRGAHRWVCWRLLPPAGGFERMRTGLRSSRCRVTTSPHREQLAHLGERHPATGGASARRAQSPGLFA